MKKEKEVLRRDHLEVCYVCNRKIHGTPKYIGQDKYRHIRCDPGSQRWLDSEVGKKSELREFFLLGVLEEKKD